MSAPTGQSGARRARLPVLPDTERSSVRPAYEPKRRDRFGVAVANLALRLLTSRGYRDGLAQMWTDAVRCKVHHDWKGVA